LEADSESEYLISLGLLRFKHNPSPEEFDDTFVNAAHDFYLFCDANTQAEQTKREAREKHIEQSKRQKALASTEQYREYASKYGEFDISPGTLSIYGVHLSLEAEKYLMSGRVRGGPYQRIKTTYSFTKLKLQIQEEEMANLEPPANNRSPLGNALHRVYGTLVLLHAQTFDHTVPIYHLMQ